MQITVAINQLKDVCGLLRHRRICLTQVHAGAPLVGRVSGDHQAVDFECVCTPPRKTADRLAFHDSERPRHGSNFSFKSI